MSERVLFKRPFHKLEKRKKPSPFDMPYEHTAMSNIRVTVSIPNATAARLKAESKNLAAQGMQIESVLDSIGAIMGSVAKGKLGKLSAGKDASIEVAQSCEIPPPDSLIQ